VRVRYLLLLQKKWREGLHFRLVRHALDFS